MPEDLSWRLSVYSFLLIPAPVLAWALLRWRKHAVQSPISRQRSTAACFVLLVLSQVTLLLFPELLELLAGRSLEPWHDIYIRAIQVGIVSALLGSVFAIFATKGTRVLLLTAGTALMVQWFLAGNSV